MSVLTGGGRDYNPDWPYWLYRYFDEQGVLLYVGIARDPVKRISEHASNQWFTYLHRVEVGESRPTRAEAEAIERVAITSELPLFNRTHATGQQMLSAIKYVRAHGHDSIPYERRLCSFATGGRHDSARTTAEQCASFTLAYERGEVAAWKLAQEVAAGRRRPQREPPRRDPRVPQALRPHRPQAHRGRRQVKPLHLTDSDGDGIGASAAAADLAASGIPGAVVVVSTHENGDWTGAALTAPQVRELIDWFSAATTTPDSPPTDLEGVTEFRRQLLVASTGWHRRFEAAMTKDDGTANPGDCMAASYAYTLAATLKAVEREAGADAAQSVARIAQEILDNGDFDDWNADVSGLDLK